MVHTTPRLHFTQNAPVVRTALSAVRHVGQYLWLGCDETATLERLTLKGDQADGHQQFAIADFLDLPDAPDQEVDVEGIAYADYYLWFVGSHSLKRKKVKPNKSAADNLKRLGILEREENRYTLGRIPLVDGQLHRTCPHPTIPNQTLTAAQLKRKKRGNELTRELSEDAHLGPFLEADIPGKDNGFDVEGLAVMGDRLWLGLRGPVLRGWAVLLELEVAADKPDVLRLQPLLKDSAENSPNKYRKHFLDLGGLGIRDLCPWQDFLLILAGPTMDLDGPVRLFTVAIADLQTTQGLLQPTVLRDLPHRQGGDRAEGITLLGPDQEDLLVVYDSPVPERLSGEGIVLADRISL